MDKLTPIEDLLSRREITFLLRISILYIRKYFVNITVHRVNAYFSFRDNKLIILILCRSDTIGR